MWIVEHLWWIPFLPFLAAGVTALLKREQKKPSATLVIGAMSVSLLLSLCALSHVLNGGHEHGEVFRKAWNFVWFSYGDTAVKLGWVLDPLSAMMLLVVSGVSLLVFIFSVGYMDHDENFTRFFCFLSLFAGSMLALVIANSLLLLFMAWELVGLSSYLLIGFWYHKPSAVAAMKKAFITTRIGDIGFFIGMIWFYSQSGTSLFYDDDHRGSLETVKTVFAGGSLALTISLLIFCGAMGKSGQFPLHVWLPDAMEGPTPVSALIHAATMVVAGVFLVGWMYPLFEVDPRALRVVAFLGAFTALFAATIAVAQWDIKRILAYSTVSQLGYMMLGLGVGGYVAGLFHLFTHAFFKALLFLGSGSIIHACHHEQDIRKMGGLKDRMPWTFRCYAIGMLALAGFPLLAGFFSKDELLLAASHFSGRFQHWTANLPLVFGLLGAVLTAFYMTRQMRYVFWGKARGHGAEHARESSRWITVPLIVLAVLSVFAGFFGFPGHSLFHHVLGPERPEHAFSWAVMLGSTVLVLGSIAGGWKLYSGRVLEVGAMDPIERKFPVVFRWLNNKYYVDEFYEWTVIALMRIFGRATDLFDRWILNGLVVRGIVGGGVLVFSWINQLIDDMAINRGFDGGCDTVRIGVRVNRWIQNGLAQHYLKITSVGIALLVVWFMILGCCH